MITKKKFTLQHRDMGTLLLVPCTEHSHSACWLFENDVPVSERFDKQPVVFKNKKECTRYAGFLLGKDFELFNNKLSFNEWTGVH